MIKRKVKKLWRGCISIREGWVNEGIQQGGLQILYEEGAMFFSPSYLKKIEYSKTVQSKFGSHTYKLADIPWKPENKSQIRLL